MRKKGINYYFIMVPLRTKSIKVWYSKAQLESRLSGSGVWGTYWGFRAVFVGQSRLLVAWALGFGYGVWGLGFRV